MSLSQKAKTFEQWFMELYLTEDGMNTKLVRLKDVQQEIDKLKLWIFGLYKKADHLSHEDERQSCAYLLHNSFGVETEEGTFGGLFLTDKAQKKLEELLKE